MSLGNCQIIGVGVGDDRRPMADPPAVFVRLAGDAPRRATPDGAFSEFDVVEAAAEP